MMANPARNYSHYGDDFEEDEDQTLPPRHANVPGSARMAMPAYRVNVIGQGESAAARVNMPRPLPNVAPPMQGRANVPPQVMMPRQRMALPAPRYNRPQPKTLNNRFALLDKLSLANIAPYKMLLGVIGGLVAISMLILLVTTVIGWWNIWQDDMTYGRPRTMQLSGWVGHNEQTGEPTNFIAQNINGEVNIYEIPGGDTSKMTVIKGPRLFGKNADLTPVKIRLEDVNTDGHVDLIATVDGSELVYINDSGKFRPASGDEVRRIMKK
ncbi:MAG: hypothetical protein HXX08_02275 [Chloroflexi bacterium]|uniref:VCBS repeat-containing protein n=1 Tax=Candidatus Chlorohelix allophototropha TaxID=3003348 RepID=A0A8T7LUX3_9CHLR|nr:hypothetical protein [Chloroflexota bacterium]WJW66571.1 hypothetical protein OZ401_002375 [Chloroflexota bacterium L227-S17]